MSEAEVQQAQTAGPRVFRVAVENVMPLWDQMRPLLAKELRVIPTHDEEDVRRAIMSGSCQLWAQWSDHLEAFALTDFVSYPRGLALRVWMGAATDADKLQWREFYTPIEAFAFSARCRWIDACGRIGWLKRFANADMAGVFMRIPIGGSEP